MGLSKSTGGVNASDWIVAESRGSVSPLAWANAPELTIIDEALNGYEIVWAATGHPHAVYPTAYAELITCTGAQPMKVDE